jgi:hypothetical protein
MARLTAISLLEEPSIIARQETHGERRRIGAVFLTQKKLVH